MYSILKKIDQLWGINQVKAHCDIPCKIYDPTVAQVATLSVIRFLHLINEYSEKKQLTLAEQATLSRLVREKEIHAAKVKEEITIIWGDYFKQPQIERFPNSHELVHQIMLTGSACKQSIEIQNGDKLLELINEFAKIFWATKEVKVYTAKCPYPPEMSVVYPKLSK